MNPQTLKAIPHLKIPFKDIIHYSDPKSRTKISASTYSKLVNDLHLSESDVLKDENGRLYNVQGKTQSFNDYSVVSVRPMALYQRSVESLCNQKETGSKGVLCYYDSKLSEEGLDLYNVFNSVRDAITVGVKRFRSPKGIVFYKWKRIIKPQHNEK